MGFMEMLGVNQTPYGVGGLGKRVISKVNDAHIPDERDGAAIAGGYNDQEFKPGAQEKFLRDRATLHQTECEHTRQQQELKALFAPRR